MSEHSHNFNIRAFIEDIESLDEQKEYSRLRSIWRAVIFQAFTDLLTKSCNKRKVSLKMKARYFLSGKDEQLYTICHYASLDAESVILKAKLICSSSKI